MGDTGAFEQAPKTRTKTKTLTTEDTEDTELFFKRVPAISAAISSTSTTHNREIRPKARWQGRCFVAEHGRRTRSADGTHHWLRHRDLGAGLLESAYETALCIELAHQGLKFDKQKLIPLLYRGVHVGDYKPDLIVENAVVVEVKSVLQFEPVFVAQMLTYLRLTRLKRGLLLNFNKSVLKAGIKRISL